jgi:long-chain acyl-CoA synthetase
LVLSRRSQEGHDLGFRLQVWPREVEDVLYAFPGVREAAVTGAPDAYQGETGDRVCLGGPRRGAGRHRAGADSAASGSPPYKCPRGSMYCFRLPKTASGKITRNTLRPEILGHR